MNHALLAVTFSVDHNQRQLGYDVLILIVLLANVIAGLRQGLIRRSIGLAAIFGGSAAATWVGNSIVHAVWHNGLYPNAWGFFAVFGVVVGMTELLSMLYADQIERASSLAFDRVAGGLMGLVTGVMMVALSVMVVLAIGDAQPGTGREVPPDHTLMADDVRTSMLGGLFAQADTGLRGLFSPVLPGDLRTHLAQSYK